MQGGASHPAAATVPSASRGGRFYSAEADADANAGASRWVRHEGSWVWRESQPSTNAHTSPTVFDTGLDSIAHVLARARGHSPSSPLQTTDETLQSALHGLADDDLCKLEDTALKSLLEALDAARARVLAAASSASSRRTAENAMRCCVCYANQKTEMLVPCGHVSMCSDCADRVVGRTRALTGKPCPICKVSPTQRLKVYL